jgi:hypothetical protein
MWPTMKLDNSIIQIRDLKPDEVERMFYLMNSHYENLNKANFIKDLKEKEGVLLIYDEDQNVQGFSTYNRISTCFQNHKITALFSGDTILNHSVWGSFAAFRAFGKLLKIKLEQENKDFYWFLISKGYRTYQLLPLFFKSFYPNYKEVNPIFEDGLIKHLSMLKFGEFYDQNTGIIKVRADYLKPDLHKLTEKSGRNEHVHFFISRNSNYLNGEELPCIAKIDYSNLTQLGLKFVVNVDNLDK